MKELYPMHGIVSTVITPFTDENKLDRESLRRQIRAGVKAGVAGFLVPCVASELPELTLEERREMTKITVDEAKGKALIIGGVTAPTLEERLDLLEEFVNLGCDGVNITVPYTTEDECRRLVAQLDAKRPPFLMVQDDDKTSYGLPDEIIVKLFDEFESFRCIKVEVLGCGPKYSNLLAATGGKLNISGGWGVDQMIEGLDRGLHAIMPSGLFELYTGVYNLYRAGDREEAKRLFYDMLPIITFTRQHGTVNRKFHKRYFKHHGIFSTDHSREQVTFDRVHQDYADELIDRADEIAARLDSYGKQQG